MPRWNDRPSGRSRNPALILRVLFAAGPLPSGAAKAPAARRDFGLAYDVLAQARAQRAGVRFTGNPSPFAPIHVRFRTDRPKVPDGTLVNAGEYASNSHAHPRLRKVRRRDRIGQSARGYHRSPLRLA